MIATAAEACLRLCELTGGLGVGERAGMTFCFGLRTGPSSSDSGEGKSGTDEACWSSRVSTNAWAVGRSGVGDL
jgi:hypothetical protein